MRLIVQRVLSASVNVDGATISKIDRGLLVLVGVKTDDTETDALYLAEKLSHLRIFEDAEGKMNLGLLAVGGSVLIVSNFTLYGDCRSGRRPSFTDAARGDAAESLYKLLGEQIAKTGVPVQWGEFGAEMRVELINDGPITFMLDSRKEF